MTGHRSTPRIVGAAAAVVLVLLGGGAASAWDVAGGGTGVTPGASLVAPSVTATRSATAPTTRIDLSWTAPSQLTGTTYDVTRTSGGTTTPVGGCTVSPCADTGLTPGAAYSYTVTARLAGWSRSGTATADTQPVTELRSFTLVVPATPQAGVVQNVTVTARDQLGATYTGYTGSKTLTWSGSATDTSAAGSVATFGPATFRDGVATVPVNLKRAGNGLVLTATDGSVSGSTTVSVTANSPARLGLTSVSSNGAAVGNCLLGCTLTGRGGNGDITTKVSVLDSYGNVTTTAAQVTVNVDKTGGTFTPTTPVVVIAASGSESAASVRLSDSGNWVSSTLTASAPGLGPNVQATIVKQ